MNIYSVYDQLLDYWAPPFVAPDDKAVLQSLATVINNGDKTNAYAQAPAQFQLWQIGQINFDGQAKERVYETWKLVASLNSLVRGSIRTESDTSRTRERNGPEHPSHPMATTTRAGTKDTF